jgi:hypothetical protein
MFNNINLISKKNQFEMALATEPRFPTPTAMRRTNMMKPYALMT